jgi:hypothetical protein
MLRSTICVAVLAKVNTFHFSRKVSQMNKSTIAFWLLLVGVLMIVIATGYKVYQAKGTSTLFTDTWTTWASVGAIAAGIGLGLSYKKVAAGVL